MPNLIEILNEMLKTEKQLAQTLKETNEALTGIQTEIALLQKTILEFGKYVKEKGLRITSR